MHVAVNDHSIPFDISLHDRRFAEDESTFVLGFHLTYQNPINPRNLVKNNMPFDSSSFGYDIDVSFRNRIHFFLPWTSAGGSGAAAGTVDAPPGVETGASIF